MKEAIDIFRQNEVRRTHDRLYLSENRKNEPKESFKFIEKISNSFLGELKRPLILDIGCATGDFLYFMSTKYPEALLYGIDVMPELLEVAEREVPQAVFSEGDIFTGKGLPETKFDAIFMNGVSSIFDECEPWLENVLKTLNKSGRAYVYGMFNPNDVDVLVRAKYAGREGEPWQPGWNLFSHKTILACLDKLGASGRFYDFNIKKDLPRNKKDPLRSWTVRVSSGRRITVNGICLVLFLSVLEIKLNNLRKARDVL